MPVRPTLIVKLTVATSVILIGFMGLLDYVNIRYFRRVMVEYAVSNAVQMAEVITQSTYDAMMKNDKANLYQMISRIARSNSIEHIRLIDLNGNVVYAGGGAETAGSAALACTFCHTRFSGSLDGPSLNRSRLYRTKEGMEVMGFTKAIYNRPDCSAAACHFHKRGDPVLGVLDISISLENLQRKSREYRIQFGVMTCLLLVLIGVLITFLTSRLVDEPIQRLVGHSAEVAAGNLDARVPVTSNDELGELSEAVNSMTESLGQARDELNEWAGTLERKVEERSREIAQMEAHLYRSEKLASLGNLVAGIAHEINNPLTGILLYASILNRDSRLDPALKPDMERVISETRRCADIVKQLLEFSREAVPRKELVSLNALLDKVAALFEQLPEFCDVAITRRYDGSLPEVYTDPGQIQQVFVNLFVNAGHAMPGGGSLTVGTALSDDGGYACARIADTGCGIPAEQLNSIFDPFYTTKSEGTGLGLSISYGIVENNGGRIEVESSVGKGSTFTVMLPVGGEE